MNNMHKKKGAKRSLICTIFGVMAVAYGGTALAAASAPAVTKFEFKETDTKGTLDSSDDTLKTITMTTGYTAYRVAVDAKGNAYVTDPEMNRIYVYNSNGHLVAVHSATVPLGVAIKGDGSIYTNGSLTDIETASGGNMFALDRSGGTVKVLDKDGKIVNVLNNGNSYVERYNSDPDTSLTIRTRTRHRLMSASGIAVDSNNGEIFVAFRESVDYLSNMTCTEYIVDANAYTSPEYTGINNTYQYWCPVSARNIVAVVDKNNGNLKRKIGLDTYPSSACSSTSITCDGVELRPQGITLDNDKDGNVRLYVATNGGIKVYDAAAGTILTPVSGGAYDTATGVVDPAKDGRFAGGAYMDIAFDSVNRRVFVTSGNRVTVYGIDNYEVPSNTAPTAPRLISPKGSYVNSKTPTLTVENATDVDIDPLTYGYEIKVQRDGQWVGVTSAVAMAEGRPTVTSMVVSDALNDNTLYRWRSQSFDGKCVLNPVDPNDKNRCLWSDEAEFCVNEGGNDNPEPPILISPVNAEPIAPFGSVLAWNASKDPDCYDTVSYVVEVSGDQAFGSASPTSLVGTSIRVASGLVNGKVYYWRVKAVDNNGAGSDYSAGSFTYKTTVVKFESDQPGTKVYIDGNYGYLGKLLNGKYDESGKLTGITPLPLDVQDITPGSHFVTFIKAGYEPVYKIANVDPLVNDGAVTVSAKAEEWVKASRIKPSLSGTELFKISGGNATPFVVDYNNDGLKDVVVGGGDGKIYFYFAKAIDGVKTYILESNILQVVDADGKAISRAVPFLVDYDNDGKKDILVGSEDGDIYLYLNNGSDSAPAFTAEGTLSNIKAVSNAAPVVVDYNNDSRKDLVVGSSDGALRLYVNIGTDDAPKYDSPVTIRADNADLTIAGSSKAFFTDWNGDGKKDLVVGGSALHLFLNVGTDEAPDFRSITALQQWIKEKKRERGNREFIPYLGYTQDIGDLSNGQGDLSPFVVDWDGSSARDVVVGNGMGEAVAYVTVIAE